MTASSPRFLTGRVMLIGALLLMNVYAPQAFLPLLANEFHLSTAQVGTVIDSTTLAMALLAPASGVLADALGRRRVMIWAFVGLVVTDFAASQVHSFDLLLGARFLQGFFIPLATVAVSAYLTEETPPVLFSRALTVYVSGTVLGGFLGRFLSGLVVHQGHWQWAFLLLSATSAVGLAVTSRLPRERRFAPQRNLGQALRTFRTHLRNPQLLTICVAGFLILFILVSVFNTVTFRLAAAPYNLGSGPLGLIFAVYLLGVVVTPRQRPC